MAQETWDPTAYISTVTNRAFDQWGKSNDEYKWAQDQFAKNSGVTDKVVDRALNTGSDFGDYAKTDRAQYERETMPAMTEQMRFAREYGTPGRAAANRAGAVAQSRLQSNQSRRNAEQQLGSDDALLTAYRDHFGVVLSQVPNDPAA